MAGLVPDAHKGKGLGNQFLDHLRQADAILHIIDASGSTDSEGNPVDRGSHDPLSDIEFLQFEMAMWVYGILDKHWARLHRQAQSKAASLHKGIAEVFTGLSITPEDVRDAEVRAGIELIQATEQGLIAFCREIVAISKPMLVVGNKVDEAPADRIEALAGREIQFASAAGELALRNAAAAHLIRYLPGDSSFQVTNEGALSPAQKAGLARIREMMEPREGTGVQQAINRTVFGILDRIVVYPVEDEGHFTDSRGRILPDAFLMKRGSTPKDLAFQVHTDIGKGFLHAVDARTKMRVKEHHELKHGDIIRIISTAK